MNAARALITNLRLSGAILGEDGGRLVVEAPDGVLTDAIKAALREQKAALLEIVGHEPLCRDADCRATESHACYNCYGRAFWRSTHGVVICAKCHPPAAPDLVAAWIGESHPAVEANHD